MYKCVLYVYIYIYSYARFYVYTCVLHNTIVYTYIFYSKCVVLVVVYVRGRGECVVMRAVFLPELKKEYIQASTEPHFVSYNVYIYIGYYIYNVPRYFVDSTISLISRVFRNVLLLS